MRRFKLRRPLNGFAWFQYKTEWLLYPLRTTQYIERQGTGLIYNLDHPATDKLLVFDESDIEFYPRGITINHKTYRTCKNASTVT